LITTCGEACSGCPQPEEPLTLWQLLFPIIDDWNAGQWVDELAEIENKPAVSGHRRRFVKAMLWLNRIRMIIAGATEAPLHSHDPHRAS